MTNNHKRQPNTFRKSASDKAVVQPAVGYGRQVGGGTVHFTANYWRFHEVDFEEQTRWVSIAGTSLADWPMKYAELEPYYTKAEHEIHVKGVPRAGGRGCQPQGMPDAFGRPL